MKSTGIVRKVDELGRVVLPIELRRNMGIEIKDSLEIFVDENTIILQKYEPADIFTGSMDDLNDYKGQKGFQGLYFGNGKNCRPGCEISTRTQSPFLMMTGIRAFFIAFFSLPPLFY